LLEILRPYGVMEMVRTGRVEMARGKAQRTPAGRMVAAPSAVPTMDVSDGSV
jgi:hypothetical protein